MALHLERADLVSAAFDDVNAAAAQDPVHPIFVDGRVSWKDSWEQWINEATQAASLAVMLRCGLMMIVKYSYLLFIY